MSAEEQAVFQKIDEAIAYSEKCVAEWQAVNQKSHTDRRAGMIAQHGIDYHTKRITRLKRQRSDLEYILATLN